MRFLVVFVLVWVACASAEPREGLRVAHGPEEKTSSPDSLSNSSPSDQERFFFFGTYSTLSHTLVSFTTSTVYASCLMGIAAPGGNVPQCGGKRRKRWLPDTKIAQTNRTSEGDELSTSQLEQLGKNPLEDNADSGEAKKFFTVWTKSITTTTLTSYSFDPATTISLTYYCSAGYIDIPLMGC